MDVLDAYKYFDLVCPADEAAIRSAYLRQLRVTKPDRDPEGFQKLREAYEVLLGSLRTAVSRGTSFGSGSGGDESGSDEGGCAVSAEVGFLGGIERELERLGTGSLHALSRAALLEQALGQHPEDLSLARRLCVEYLEAGRKELAAETAGWVLGRLNDGKQPTHAGRESEAGELWQLMVDEMLDEAPCWIFRHAPAGVSVEYQMKAVRHLLRQEGEMQSAASLLVASIRNAAPRVWVAHATEVLEVAVTLASHDLGDWSRIVLAALVINAEGVSNSALELAKAWAEGRAPVGSESLGPASLDSGKSGEALVRYHLLAARLEVSRKVDPRAATRLLVGHISSAGARLGDSCVPEVVEFALELGGRDLVDVAREILAALVENGREEASPELAMAREWNAIDSWRVARAVALALRSPENHAKTEAVLLELKLQSPYLTAAVGGLRERAPAIWARLGPALTTAMSEVGLVLPTLPGGQRDGAQEGPPARDVEAPPRWRPEPQAHEAFLLAGLAFIGVVFLLMLLGSGINASVRSFPDAGGRDGGEPRTRWNARPPTVSERPPP